MSGAPLVLLAAAVGFGYLALVLRQGSWPHARTASFLTGTALLALALAPVSPWPEGDMRGHMLQHLLIGMLAPMALVLGAPLTLVLRTAPRRWGRRIVRVMHSLPARFAVHPVTVLVLYLGGLVVLYATPLHMSTNPFVLVHFLVSGYLFAWLIAGPDPCPRRPSVPARLVLLGLAVAVHAVVAQLLYAGILHVHAPVAERRGAAELMYYGGDLAEILLAFAMLSRWRPRRVVAAR